MKKKGSRVDKIRRKYGSDCFRKFGRRGGSPILAAWSEKKSVKGYKVTHK